MLFKWFSSLVFIFIGWNFLKKFHWLNLLFTCDLYASDRRLSSLKKKSSRLNALTNFDYSENTVSESILAQQKIWPIKCSRQSFQVAIQRKSYWQDWNEFVEIVLRKKCEELQANWCKYAIKSVVLYLLVATELWTQTAQHQRSKHFIASLALEFRLL